MCPCQHGMNASTNPEGNYTMTIRKLAISLIALSTLAVASTAMARPAPFMMKSALVRTDAETLTVDFRIAVRGCAVLIDQDGYKVQDTPQDFCGTPDRQSVSFDLTSFDVEIGDELKLCSFNMRHCSEKVIVRQAGDLNSDGAINVLDLIIINDYVQLRPSTWWPQTSYDLDAADLNGDHAVNVVDILLLIDLLWEN
jgi:hypothetical protein